MKINKNFKEMKIKKKLACILSILRIVKAEMEPYIVGGDSAKISKYPHSAFLAITCDKPSKYESWACGASILNQKLLLSAAHCIESCLDAWVINVKVGTKDISKGGGSNSVENVNIHQDYDERTIINDIALLKLKTSLIYGHSVKRIAFLKETIKNEPAYVAGWGLVDENAHITTVYLKEAKQTVLSRRDCIRLLKNMYPNTICTKSGYNEGSKFGYAAQGDSGSALIVRDYIQIGIVSYKRPKLAEDIVVFTNVGKYYNWIKTTARQLYCEATWEQVEATEMTDESDSSDLE